MSNKLSQNIFDYATSELSQDAFISLLVAWFDSKEEELRDISRNFISSLYTKYFNKSEKLVFTKMNGIKLIQQHYKIDVFFELIYNGEKISFIIEDKTWTEPHSDQLSRYVQKVSNHNLTRLLAKLKNLQWSQSSKHLTLKDFNYQWIEFCKKSKEEIVKIFFKTGHITEKDKAETEKADYKIINVGWIYNFLNQYEIDNIIFNNYKDYLEKNFYEKLYKDNKKKELKDWTFQDVNNGFVQYEIIKEIKNNVNINNTTHIRCINFTRNGKLWDTWWSFYNDGFSLFVKIKRIGTSYRIRLIKYSQSKVASVDKQSNLEDFSSYIDNFLELNKDTSIQKTKKPRYKAREIELAFLEFDNNITLENSVKEFSHFIEFFIEKIMNI